MMYLPNGRATNPFGPSRRGSWFHNRRPTVIQGFLIQRAEKPTDAQVLAGNGSYKLKRGAYLNIVRDAILEDNEQSFVNFDDFVSELDNDSRSTVAGAIHPGAEEIYVTSQANDIDSETLEQAAYSAGYDNFDIEIVQHSGTTGLHAEMQILLEILTTNTPLSGWYFSAAGKNCCRVCAGMISALGSHYASVGQQQEYAWYDPFVGNKNKHPIKALKPYVNAIGVWNKALYNLG